jgi:uncharacterized SAM-binding protein YcdF (DUF218 family)
VLLDKVLTQMAYPLGISLALGLLALVWVLAGRRRLGAGALAVALFWLGFWSLPVVSDSLRFSLEAQSEELAVEALPTADAVVVLGGTMRPAAPGEPYPDLGSAADRVWHAARIFHAGRAPVVIVSAGNLPWLDTGISEARAIEQFLSDLGVPSEAILLEERSANTRQNALFTGELMRENGLETALLVTSALHMPRALAAFLAAGVAVSPAATDFEVRSVPVHVLRWVPDAGALASGARAVKEYLGLWVYRWRGWA